MHFYERLVSFVVLIILFLCVLSGCAIQSLRETLYYSNGDNYIQTSGIVSHYQYADNDEELYIGFTTIPDGCENLNFMISGDELVTAKKNGIDEYVAIGSEITFVTAPKMFGDGYCPPIVGLECEGEIIIPFSSTKE